MAYHNASGQVTIDEAAANADIQKMRGAIEKLEASKNSISRMRASASSMRGETGSAIVEQCTRLERQLQSLTENLNASIRYIRSTVEKYAEEDRMVAQQIRSGGGF